MNKKWQVAFYVLIFTFSFFCLMLTTVSEKDRVLGKLGFIKFRARDMIRESMSVYSLHFVFGLNGHTAIPDRKVRFFKFSSFSFSPVT